MTSFCVQLLAGGAEDASPVQSYFVHEQALAEAERLAAARSAEIPGVAGYRIIDMGGAVHATNVASSAR